MRLNVYEAASLLSADYGASGIFTKKSAILHKHAERRVFSGCAIGAGVVVTYHYESFVYSDLFRQKRLKKKYREGMMALTGQQFLEWALRTPGTIVDGTVVKQTSWIFPGPSCGLWYNNDVRYF